MYCAQDIIERNFHFLQFIFYFLYLSVCLDACTCTTCLQCPWGQKEVSDPLELLEVEMVVSNHVELGTESSSFAR